MGCVPVHVPGSAVRVWPCRAVQEIVGGLVFCGPDAAAAEPAPKRPIAATRMISLRM